MRGSLQRHCNSLDHVQRWIASASLNVGHVGAGYAGNVRERLLGMGGGLEVESEPGNGTRVTFVAPMTL